jgi:hypothetical protein
MNQAITPQHPAVVLRSHYRQLRNLLAIATIAIVGLTVAVVILATNDHATTTKTAAPVAAVGASAQTADTGARLDHRGLGTDALTTRYDGGPEEGTRGSSVAPSQLTTRYDGGPEEGTRGPGR